MKPARTFAQVSRRFYRPEQSHCPVCQRRLRRAVTLTERTVITLEEVIKLVHAGYRCPDTQCAGYQRTYRSVKADALALPWFTYGVDIVLLVGRLRLREHQTVDEIHQELLKRLEPLGVKIARREVLYLFEAYCTLLRASSEAKDDVEWLAQVEKNGGIIVSVDGIQPEKGNETVYLVRDALTGRVLAAENVTSSETAVMKALLASVVALGVNVLGTISDAQESELLAVEELWPEVPHQVCQFHVLRDASKTAEDRRQADQNGDAQTPATQGEGGTQTDQEVPEHGLAPGSQAARGARRLRHGDPDGPEHRWAAALQVCHGGSQPDVR